MARANGWPDRLSAAAASARQSAGAPSNPYTPTTCGCPVVIVPVLSKATARNRPRFSRCAPPFTSTPPRAARATPASTAAGVPNASAHGDAATNSVMARRKDSRNGMPSNGGMTISRPAPISTAGTNTRITRSTVCCVGDFCACASSTMCITRARVLSCARRVTRTSNAPSPLIVPANTGCPASLPPAWIRPSPAPGSPRKPRRRPPHPSAAAPPV